VADTTGRGDGGAAEELEKAMKEAEEQAKREVETNARSEKEAAMEKEKAWKEGWPSGRPQRWCPRPRLLLS
jgi:hypothetical protein